MTEEEILAYGATLPGARCDRPFEGDFETAVLRHADTGKWFAVLLEAPEKLFGVREKVLNLKCPPELSGLLAESDPNILPAYHMNKRLWISVRFRFADAETVRKLIALSFELTTKRGKKAKNENNL